MDLIEVKVPDIGDFKDVPVIELLVKAGDTVQVDDALVTLESDKATMDVPAPTAGIIREVKVQLGDRVSEGSVIALVEAVATAASSQGESAPAAPAVAPTPTASTPAPEAGSFAGQADVSCDMQTCWTFWMCCNC